MSGSRHLFGDQLPVRVTVPDSVTVKPGDLMIFCDEAGASRNATLNANVRALSGTTGYAYPWAAGCTLTSKIETTSVGFLGVSLDDSPNGVTTNIGVATAGVFEFPLVTASAVTVGRTVHSSLPTGFSKTSQTTASYQVNIKPQAHKGGVTIGHCYHGKSGAKTVQVLIRTKYGVGGIASV